jgi:hypothetical protein
MEWVHNQRRSIEWRALDDAASEFRCAASAMWVLVAMHPHNLREVALLRGVCDQFVYAERGTYRRFDTFAALAAHPGAQAYLAPLG